MKKLGKVCFFMLVIIINAIFREVEYAEIAGWEKYGGYDFFKNMEASDIGIQSNDAGGYYAWHLSEEDTELIDALGLGNKQERRDDLIKKGLERFKNERLDEIDNSTADSSKFEEEYAKGLLKCLREVVDEEIYGTTSDTFTDASTDTTDNNTSINVPIIDNTNTVQIDESVGSGFDASIITDSDDYPIDSNIEYVGNRIASTVITVLQIIAFAGIIIVGLKYMFTSADQKADIKMSVTYLIAGMVLVFGASTVAKFSVKVVNDLETAQEEAIRNDPEAYCEQYCAEEEQGYSQCYSQCRATYKTESEK